ncbi:hypothetical protein RHS01_05889 [Rhizoctonia solani]|uniref:BTB domain-containing protein n=1 Tax=Rhizoctonia solani TaxID=456999 RepID=A0A8H7IAD0_9AGAM|nr:hypothetical protein RHS01_05889 [Rhizoctonia solani]
MFKLPKDVVSDSEEGLKPENPIVLEGVTMADFEALLQVLYASHYAKDRPEPKPTLIIPAFRLANMWRFAELCAHLMPIAETMFSEVDKIVFAREFQLEEWIIPAHIKLCQRDSPLNSEEATKIGLSSVLFISRIREERLKLSGQIMADNIIRDRAEDWIKGGMKIGKSNTIGSIGADTAIDDSGATQYNALDAHSKPASSKDSVSHTENIVQKHPTLYFDDTVIFIKLEDTLFSVHKMRLIKSKSFSKWFELQNLSSKPEECNEGLSSENPIVIQGISMSDFEGFLKVLYASHFSDNRSSHEISLIISAYRLAVLWQFSELQDFLFSLVDQSFDDPGKIAFAKSFGLKDWLQAPHQPTRGISSQEIGLASIVEH